MFGSPETTTGGRALKFYASVRLDIRRIGQIKEGDQDIGCRTRVKVSKNKMAPPFKLAEFDILYGTGISRTGDLLDLAITHRIIDKAGAWFSYGETRLGQGRENVRQFLDQNIDLRDEIEVKVRRLLGLTKEPKGAVKSDEKIEPKEAAPVAIAAKDAAPRPAAPRDEKSLRDEKAARDDKPARDPARPRGPAPTARP